MTTGESISEKGYRAYRDKLTEAFTHDPALVLLPENAFPYFELNEENGTLIENSLINFNGRDVLYQDFISLSRAHASTTIAVGLHTFRAGKRYNSVAFFEEGKPISYYHKRILVPFTEYAPFGLSLPMYMRFTSGSFEQPLSISGNEWDALICSEIADTNINTKSGGVILASSNDSVFLGA